MPTKKVDNKVSTKQLLDLIPDEELSRLAVQTGIDYWDIEVFFRFIKQELNFNHFMSTNSNGIKITLYMTLILSMLIHIYKKYNDVGFRTAKRRIKMELDDLLTILIIQACGGDPNIVFRGP